MLHFHDNVIVVLSKSLAETKLLAHKTELSAKSTFDQGLRKRTKPKEPIMRNVILSVVEGSTSFSNKCLGNHFGELCQI